MFGDKPTLSSSLRSIVDGKETLIKKINDEIKWIKSNKPFAISEIGLDYHNGKNKEKQKKYFVKFLEIAKSLSIPAIIHSRNAESDVIEIIEKFEYNKIVLHCFSGNKKLIKKGIELKLYFSIPTNIVRSHQFQELVKLVPLSRILTETDSPYLSQNPGEISIPSDVIESVKKIAEIKGISKEECSKIIFMNFQRLFI